MNQDMSQAPASGKYPPARRNFIVVNLCIAAILVEFFGFHLAMTDGSSTTLIWIELPLGLMMFWIFMPFSATMWYPDKAKSANIAAIGLYLVFRNLGVSPLLNLVMISIPKPWDPNHAVLGPIEFWHLRVTLETVVFLGALSMMASNAWSILKKPPEYWS